MQFRSLFIVALLSLLVLAFGCSQQPAAPADDETAAATTEETLDVAADEAVESPEVEPTADTSIVASINGRNVSRQDLDIATDDLLAQYQQIYSQFGMDIYSMLVGAEGRIFGLRIQSEALDSLFFEALVDLELERRGLALTDEEIDQEFDVQLSAFLDSQGITLDEFEAQIEAQGYDVEEFMAGARKTIGQQLKYEAAQRAVSEPLEFDEDELVEYFEANRANYETEEQIRASHILVDTEEEAIDLHLQLADGADFATLAQEYSTDTGSAENGGDLGWFSRGQMVTEFEEAAFALEIGQLSEIVETDYGFHIILLTDHRDATSPEYAEVADQVLSDLEAETMEARFSAWYENAYESAEMTVYDPLLQAMRTRIEDTDAGLASFEALKADGSVQEPYLSYIIGSIYEAKMYDAETEQRTLESQVTEELDYASELAELDATIDEYRSSALAAYQDALDDFGGSNTEIESKIETLTPAEEPEAEAAETVM